MRLMRKVFALLFVCIIPLVACSGDNFATKKNRAQENIFKNVSGTYEYIPDKSVLIDLEYDYYHLFLDEKNIKCVYKIQNENESFFETYYSIKTVDDGYFDKPTYSLTIQEEDNVFPFVNWANITVSFDNEYVPSIIAQSYGVDSQNGKYLIMHFDKAL